MEPTEAEIDEHILALAAILSREVNLYFLAHGQSRESLMEVFTAFHLLHMELHRYAFPSPTSIE